MLWWLRLHIVIITGLVNQFLIYLHHCKDDFMHSTVTDLSDNLKKTNGIKVTISEGSVTYSDALQAGF